MGPTAVEILCALIMGIILLMCALIAGIIFVIQS